METMLLESFGGSEEVAAWTSFGERWMDVFWTMLDGHLCEIMLPEFFGRSKGAVGRVSFGESRWLY